MSPASRTRAWTAERLTGGGSGAVEGSIASVAWTTTAERTRRRAVIVRGAFSAMDW